MISHAESTEDAGVRLRRIGTIMCIAVAIGGALIELILIWIWLVPGYVEAYVAPRIGLGGTAIDLGGASRFSGFLISCVPFALLGYMLDRAYRIFDTFRLGNMFEATVPVHLRQIGLSAVILALLSPVVSAALSVALTMSNPPGGRMLAITLGSSELLLAGFGGLVLAIGHVMTIARSIAEDHRAFI